MARGRPPKPREVRLAEGNPGRRALPEPVLGLGKVLDFPPPDELNEAERAAWEALVPEVSAAGWVDRLDRQLLTTLVQAVALAEMARASVREEGFMLSVYDKDGNAIDRKVNPAVRVQIQANAQVLRIAEQFGLTPSARARLGLAVAKGTAIAQHIAAVLDDDDDGVIDVPDSPPSEG